MTADVMQSDFLACRRIEKRTFTASIAAHVVLLLLLLRGGGPEVGEGEELTEVSLLESSAPTPAAAPAALAAPAPLTQRGVLQVREDEVHFRRSDPGDAEPEPQSDHALEDRLNEKLATLQRDPSPSLAGLATVTPRMPQLASPTGMPSATGSGGSALALRRAGPEGTGHGTAPLELSRGGSGGGRDLRLAQLPADRPAPPSASPPPKAVSKQALSGMSLAGPIADRPVINAVRPEYPDWAKQEAVEGSVTLQFVVMPDGTLKPNVMVQKTAGFGDFDDNAIAALRQWRFAPLARGRTGEQWGTITFHFRLADAR